MKILFTGGGTGGHFYPIIAVAQALNARAKEKKILQPKLYFMSPTAYNPRALFDNEIEFVQIPAGKMRRYFSILNFTDLFKTAYGVLSAISSMFSIYPDVVFAKGGFTSFPALVAARIWRIPVIIHESDSHPGRVSMWASKFAYRIAVSYPEVIEHLPKKIDRSKIAFTGNPVRAEIQQPLSNGAREFLNLEEKTPVILIIGGSQGSQRINDCIIDALPELVTRYQIIHQTGKHNFEQVKDTMKVVLKDNPDSYRYHPFDYLNDLAIRMSAGIADIVISRAGSTIFEIALWGLPSIIIPLSQEVSHDQTENAFSYAKSGACVVIEEHNLSSHILTSEIDRIIGSQNIRERMKISAKAFAHTDSAQKIADVLLEVSLGHEK